MPKRPSAAKLAAAAVRLSDALDSACEGRFEIGLIEKCLGRSQFLIRLNRSTNRIVAITSAVLRAKPCRAEPGHYLIVDGAEVQGVINQSSQVKQLRRAGRTLPESEEAVGGGLDEMFEMDRSAPVELDIWGKRDEERLAQADEREARIRAKRAGALKASTAPLLRLDGGADADPADAEVEPVAEELEAAAAAAPAPGAPTPSAAAEDAHYAARHKQTTSARRTRAARMEQIKLALFARILQRAWRSHAAAVAGVWAAALRAEYEEDLLALRAAAPVPERWDDEVDINAI